MSELSNEKIINKKILTIAIPLIIQQFSIQLQTYINRAMLGHIDSQYFSAIGNVLVPFYAVTSIITAVCAGTTILIAQNFGAKNETQAKIYAEYSFIGNSFIPIIAFLFFFFASDYMFKLMGVKSPILEYSSTYIRILSFTLLISGFSSTAVSILQGIGMTKIILYAGIISNALNIFLDWILIFGNLGFPKMGLQGAAYATTISNFLTAPIIIIYIFKNKKMPFRLKFNNIFHFRLDSYKKVFKIGIPSGMESALWNIGNFIVVSFLNRLDTLSVGIYTLIFSLENLPLFLYMGFANASLTLVGIKMGEDENDQAIKIGFRCLCFSLAICVIAATLFLIFPKEILSLFTNDENYINYAAPFLTVVSFTMFPKSINNVIGLGIRGIGDTKWMLYGQIMGTIFVIILSYILIFTVNLGLLGIFITFLIDETIRSVINFLRFWKGREFFLMKPFEKVITTTENKE